jgi:electron transport complex protein RnfG
MSDIQPGPGNGAPPSAPEPPQVESFKLLRTLALAGAIAGFVLVFVYQATQPAILAYKAEVLRQSIQEVLKAPDRYDTLYVHDGRLTAELPAGVDGDQLEQVYLGYLGQQPVGFAIASQKAGFQDIIRVIYGYDPRTNSLLGMKVLESKETPGLGDKIEKDSSFVNQFDGSEPMLVGVTRRRATGAANEIDMITGATISSRTIVDIINISLERLGPLLENYSQVANR